MVLDDVPLSNGRSFVSRTAVLGSARRQWLSAPSLARARPPLLKPALPGSTGLASIFGRLHAMYGHAAYARSFWIRCVRSIRLQLSGSQTSTCPLSPRSVLVWLEDAGCSSQRARRPRQWQPASLSFGAGRRRHGRTYPVHRAASTLNRHPSSAKPESTSATASMSRRPIRRAEPSSCRLSVSSMPCSTSAQRQRETY